jgi:hypothetical protein
MKYQDKLPREDIDLWERVILWGQDHITILNEPLIYYRIHQNQIGSRIK